MEFIFSRRFCHALEGTFHFVNQKKQQQLQQKKKNIDLVNNVDEFVFRFFWRTRHVVLKEKILPSSMLGSCKKGNFQLKRHFWV